MYVNHLREWMMCSSANGVYTSIKVIQVNTVMKLKFKHQKFQEEAAAAV